MSSIRPWIIVCYVSFAANATCYPDPFNMFIAGLCLGGAVIAHIAHRAGVVT